MGKAATKHVQNDHNGFANFCCIIYEVVCANSFFLLVLVAVEPHNVINILLQFIEPWHRQSATHIGPHRGFDFFQRASAFVKIEVRYISGIVSDYG